MKPIRVLTLLLALALLVGAAPPARTAEPLNTLNDADATERPAFDFVQDRLLSGFSGSLAPTAIQSSAGDWHIECVDCPKYFENMTDHSLRLDGDGHPHIAYGGDHLYYAWHDGTRWHYETVDESPGVGGYASLTLDGSGQPHISYYDWGNNGDLKYAWRDGTAWQIETVDSAAGSHTSLALDGAGRPHISYQSISGLKCLKYAWHDGSGWQIETVDSEGWVGRSTSLALDGSGQPHISYLPSGDLKYARRDGTGWHTETVNSGGGLGGSSLALDGAGWPHISYHDLTNEDLKYASHDGSGWQIETVDSDGIVGYHTSLALDGSGRPHISYYDWTNGDLKYAWHDGTGWQIKTVDSAGIVGWSTSLALDGVDRPHISYHDWTNDDLKYAWHDGTAWQIETVDSAGDVGEYTSLALDGAGRPHISYHDQTNYDLKYAWHDGTTWQIEMVDSEGWVGRSTSLALDGSGRPHISYWDYLTGDLKYAWHDGTTWQIETVNSAGSVGRWTSLALDGSGWPHISYCDWSNRDLKYAWRNLTSLISGHVRDGGGNPISGVAVSAGAGGSAVTDASGAYTISVLTAGTYVLTASKSGYVFSPAARVVRVPPSVSEQDFTTTPVYGTLNGRVAVQGSGTAIANARVSAGGKVGRTDASGDYLLTGILPGLHGIYVSADGYEDYKGEVTIEADTSTTRDVALEAILVDGYYLPYPGGKTYECTQGNGGSFSHQGSWYYAFDFGMPDGRKVVAARDGRVVTVKEDSNTSCNSKACIPYANYVRIRHEDGTDTLYYHLKYQKVFVEEGQCVSRGQVIAESDTTGWCTGAHLDFTRHEWGQWKSRRISFVDVPGDGVPRTSGRYTSGNYPVTTGVGESNVAEDTDPPRGSVQFRLTGQPTHILQLWAADYASDVTAMRLAATETGIQAATWQSFTTSAEWTGPVVFAQYKDANGNVSSVVSDTVDAIGYEPIQAAFAISPTVCVGSGLPLANQTVPFCEQCGWAWDFGDGTTSAEAEPQFDYVAMSSFSGYATPDTYTVTLTVSNAVSASSVSHQVTALAAPAAEFSLIRSGATITVEAEATGAAGWTWDFGDGITATGRIATHTYTDTSSLNTYPVQLVVEGNNGCASLGYQYVSSYALYLPLILRNR